MNPLRRLLLRRLLLRSVALGPLAGTTLATAPPARAGLPDYPPVLPRALDLARDRGAHPDYRSEWWYLTAQVDVPDGTGSVRIGLQLTFFRLRPALDTDNPSAFAAHQLIVAHAAIADPRRAALLHESRLARAGFGIAQAGEGDTRVGIDHWSLDRDPVTGIYAGRAKGASFTLEIQARPTQPVLLQGQGGYSRKGPPDAAGTSGQPAASYYYSEPQLALTAQLELDGRRIQGTGRGWLDHEWSSTLLPRGAQGWDWGGFNLEDGSALTFFRIRAAPGAPPVYAYAALRPARGSTRLYAPGELQFTDLRTWTSPATRARYPVALDLLVGGRRLQTRPLMDDQEFDARTSSGLVYWEGASALLENGKVVGHGYLELTGYAGPMVGNR